MQGMWQLCGGVPLGSGSSSAFHVETDFQGDGGDTEMNKGYLLPAGEGVSKAVAGILKKCLDEKLFEAVFVPVRTEDSYNYVLLKDTELLEKIEIMPPVMPVQGGKAVMNLTRHGKSKKIAAVMRMCEIRAAVELSKLRQIDLENIFFISMDCSGVMSLSDYLQEDNKDSVDAEKKLRPLCEICENFSVACDGNEQVVDLCIGRLGIPEGNVLLIPVSEGGKELINKLGMTPEEDTGDWLKKVSEKQKNRKKAAEKALAEIEKDISGLDGLLKAFSKCIECHNCRSVCPICYCRLCFTDKGTLLDTADNYVLRAESSGALKILPEPLLFHLGRMSHMSLSCVSCGMCEDVCPVDIPVGRIFSFVSKSTRDLFDYFPGRSREEKLPYVKFELEELTEVEDR